MSEKERIAELEAENEKLRAAVSDSVVAATMLREMSVTNGGINMQLEGGMCQFMAESFADQFVEAGGINFVEMGFHSKSRDLNLLVTIQRVDGKTPAMLKAESEKTRNELLQALEDLDALGGLGQTAHAMIRAAIAKAKGKE